MTTNRLSLLLSVAGLAIIGWAVTGCQNFPDCDSDQTCVEYNQDEGSDGYGRGLVVCIDGTCRQCRSDGDCERGYNCNNNSCQRIPGWCERTNDCPDGQICVDNYCTPGCDDVHGCGRCQLCQANVCVRDPDCCDLDSDCPDGFRCENHRCVVARPCADREFETVYFDFDESVIRVDQEPRLEHNAECLNAFPQENIRIEGHCDERGTDAYNLALGERRSRSSKRYLERLGVDDDRMDLISYGESRPVCRQSNESCWRQNRRTEFIWR